MKNYILVIDEGTTGTRALIFDRQFKIVAQSYEEFTQYTPSEDKVEHDAMEIYEKSVAMCKKALAMSNIKPEEIAAIGITNQRATSVVWDKNTGEPLYRAIVWQDNRTAARCAELNASEWGEKAKKATGWTIAPVYSSLMLEWLLKNNPEVKAKVDAKEALFGTIDTWLVWKLTGGKVHAVSYSNASVMGSLDLSTADWYKEFLDYLGIPMHILPEIREDSGDFGVTDPSIFGCAIPIGACIADQHSALYAQGCRVPGTAKLTNGTGSFLDVNIGENCVVLNGGINTVIAWKIKGRILYAMEGYAAVTGSAVQWLRDGLNIIEKSADSEALARSVPDTNGVYFVPALTGLGAPYWDPFARGTTKAHICRAALECMAFQVAEAFRSMEEFTGMQITALRADGGGAKSDFLCQFQADILGVPVERPKITETTCLGAAYLAGLATGFFASVDEVSENWQVEKRFEPRLTKEQRDELMDGWKRAVERASNWIKK